MALLPGQDGHLPAVAVHDLRRVGFLRRIAGLVAGLEGRVVDAATVAMPAASVK